MALFQGFQLIIKGRVQGVGFRPFIWQLANRFNVTGKVLNNAEGVVVELFAKPSLTLKQLDAFKQAIVDELPPLARLDTITDSSISSAHYPRQFTIVSSATGLMNTEISPDMATCAACIQELFARDDRRYQYPFINCTHCGPRLSIIKKMPYDRPYTAMNDFPLCLACQQEYNDPNNRRFHAQPNACPDCGPNIWLANAQGQRLLIEHQQVIHEACALLKQGKIIALKDLGGFHLVCDAQNEQAVATLRKRKNRPSKPFAIMLNEPQLSDFVLYQQEELDRLKSSAAPIVLLSKKISTATPIAPSVAPGQLNYGVMLPANPLQHLLLAKYQQPLVMTSGNASGLPPCIDNKQALAELADIADVFLLHNRDIINRLDDSLMRLLPFTLNGKRPWQVIRRARGLVPQPIKLNANFKEKPHTLALGADLKNSFCLLKNGAAIVSQYLGDLDKLEVFNEYQRQLQRYQQLYDMQAQLIAYDQHPNYKSNYLLSSFPAANHQAIQHHHAHAVSVLAEHNISDGNALALTLDGLGFNDDNESSHNLWGGELLLINYQQYQHLWGMPGVAMPGGDIASKQPWRNLVAQVKQFAPERLPELPALLASIDVQQINLVAQILDKNINSPSASSAGRLFDAVATLLNLAPEQQSYEGEAAIAVENSAGSFISKNTDSFDESERFFQLKWDSTQLWHSLFFDLEINLPVPHIAYNFHYRLACMLSNEILAAAQQQQVFRIILTGGVCQNALLLTLLIAMLEHKQSNNLVQKLDILLPQQLPANDGGLALGQALIANSQ